METEKTIKAGPTKEFFISMLTKDISLTRAIIDLVDNCVDGAKRMSPDGDYNGLTVDLLISEDLFSINDNCGGIDPDTATEYAFRFGRPSDAPTTQGSVGLFGVGMKRAIFKMGNKFTITSSTKDSNFQVIENIKDWKGNPDNWEFKFSELIVEEEQERVGTTIVVEQLFPSIASDFSQETFITNLHKELAMSHCRNLSKGLVITLNSVKVEETPIRIRHGENLTPAKHVEIISDPVTDSSVSVSIYTGVSEPNPKKAGWYIFCNERLVLEADQTELTGWRLNGVPQYHNDYASFRGYICFDSDTPSALPWNTTKTGLDWGAATYRHVKKDMARLMKQTIDFLRELRKEKENSELPSTPLQDALEESSLSLLFELPDESFVDHFVYPTPVRPPRRSPKIRKIQYSKSVEEIECAQEVLNASSLKQLGEMTFDYFYERECD